jgi:hypothetical protein
MNKLSIAHAVTLCLALAACGGATGEVSDYAHEDETQTSEDVEQAAPAALVVAPPVEPRTECAPYTDATHEVVHTGYCTDSCKRMGYDTSDPGVACVTDGLTWCCRKCVDQ